jgi:multiple sugar transport system ATP-binding protein
MSGVILENVSRTYPGGVAAVDGVSLEVHDREFLVLVGPSGCGKTTTLRLIAGLEELSGGKITIGERLVNDVAAKHRDIAMVFQNYALYPHMTVYRNMAFGLELREGMSGWRRLSGWRLWRWVLPADKKRRLAAQRFAIAERVHEAARTLGIEPLLERYPRQLSGGERQRVALGRAIVRNPAVFLFDEPLSNLDAKLRVEMRRELKQLHQRLATTMIYVTHDQVEALTLGDRIVVMQGGTIQQVGPPMEVYDWPANRFVAGFIGTPGMNFVDGEIGISSKIDAQVREFRRGSWSVSLADRRLDLPVGASGLPATLGVRSEDVRISTVPVPGSQPAIVDLVEMLGDAAVITVRMKATNSITNSAQTSSYDSQQDEDLYVLSKTEARTDLRPGGQVFVSFDEQRLHVFDPSTGKNLVQRPS